MTLECTGRCVILKYEVNIDTKKLLTKLFRVDVFTSYFSIALTLGLQYRTHTGSCSEKSEFDHKIFPARVRAEKIL